MELYLKPFLAFRNIHSLTKQNSEARTDYEDIQNGVSFNMYQGFPDLNLQLSNSGFTFKSSPYWYNGITYSDEARRGFDCKEDLFVPGLLHPENERGRFHNLFGISRRGESEDDHTQVQCCPEGNERHRQLP